MITGSPRNIQATRDIVDGNLRYTSSGYWAEYQVEPHEYGSRSTREKKLVRHDHEQLAKAVFPRARQAVLTGTLAPETAKDITAKSLNGLDPRAVPKFAEITADRIAELKEDPFYWPKIRKLGLAFPVGKNRELAQRNRARILAAIPRAWRLTPAQPQDMEWLWSASIHRGVWLVPRPAKVAGVVDLSPAGFDDGAKDDDIPGFSAYERPPVIKITPKNSAPSYQALLKVTFPDTEMQFPGGTEIFHVLDRTGLPVDWVIRCEHYPRRQVMHDNDDVAKVIQSNLYETALETMIVDEDAIAGELTTEYSAKIAQTRSDSARWTVIFAVGARCYDDLEKAVFFLEEVFAHMHIEFERIAGLQQDLWAAMLPGTPSNDTIRAMADENTVSEFAEMVPFATASVGSPTGPILGRCVDSGLQDLFRIDFRALLAANIAANFALLGDLGAGKTNLLQLVFENFAALGDPFFLYDRTDKREQAKFVSTVPGNIIVDLLNPERSVCPLKTFRHDPRAASRHALATLIPKLKFEVGTDEVVSLSEALTADSIVSNELTSMRRLTAHMLDTPGSSVEAEAARKVGRHLRMWGNFEFARALYDESLDPIDYDAPAICLLTTGLPAASPEAIYNPHLFKRLRPEQLFVESVYELTGLAMHEHYFNSPRLCGIGIDEGYHLTLKPVGKEMLEATRDSRKHGVVMGVASHLANPDLMSLESLKLFGITAVGRTGEKGAFDNLEWAGMHPESNPDLVTDISERFTTGDFIVRFFRQVAQVRVFQSTSAALRAATDTTFRAAI
jgi:AAA-like domain